MKIIYITEHLWQTEEMDLFIKDFIKFNIAFQKATLKKDSKNPFLKNSYVSLDNIFNTCRPLLSENGFIVTQDLAGGYLTTQLMHSSGQFKGSAMEFNPMTSNSGTNKLQAIGGGITYAKRYSVAAILGLSVDKDDDGEGMKGQDITKDKKKTKKQQPKTTPNANSKLTSIPPEKYSSIAEFIKTGETTSGAVVEEANRWTVIAAKYKVTAAATRVILDMVDKLIINENKEEH